MLIYVSPDQLNPDGSFPYHSPGHRGKLYEHWRAEFIETGIPEALTEMLRHVAPPEPA